MTGKLDINIRMSQHRKKNEMLNFIKVKNIWSLKDSEKKKNTRQCTDIEKDIYKPYSQKKMTCYWIYKELLKLKKPKLCKLK